MRTDFRRIAVINRGEPAMRLIHVVREHNLQHGEGLTTIAFYTDPDRNAPFVREADEAVHLGPATFVDSHDGRRRTSYLDLPRIQEALDSCGAEAAWAGWGFLGERADFVELCDRLGVVFIGPDAASMRRLGHKISAKRLADEIGVPVMPWAGEAALTLDAARAHARRLGYPVIIKAAAGAGGRGLRRAQSEAELAAAFISARQEAGRTFGDPTVFVERWMPFARHIEVQVQGDRHGTLISLGVRECSLQRRLQKLVAEAPPPSLTRDEEYAVREYALRLCHAAGYRDQASVEFLFDAGSRQFAFIEANPRVQVEHAVTELTTGLDLVKLQLEMALGGRLDPTPPRTTGHAVEARLNAEDPSNQFAASPGQVEFLRIPTGPGLRVELGVADGDAVPAEYDAMLGHIAASGPTRNEALGRLQRALGECAIVVSGGATNRAFLRRILEYDEVRDNRADVGWLDRLTAAEAPASEQHADVALLVAAVEIYDAEFAAEVRTFFATASRLRPVVRAEAARQIEVSYHGHHYQFSVSCSGPAEYRVEVDGQRVDLRVERVGPVERWVACNGRRHHVLAAAHGYTWVVEVDDVPHAVSRADAGMVHAPSPAMVVSVLVEPGARVDHGAPLAVLEAMKMEMTVVAPFAATVRQIFVMNNSQVGAGTPLVHLEPTGEARPGKDSARVEFEGAVPVAGPPRASRARALLRGVRAGLGELTRTPADRALPVLDQLRRVVLGFDWSAQDLRRLLRDYARLVQPALPGDDDEIDRLEDQMLTAFVDLAGLFARQPGAGGTEAGLSPEEYLLTYLRTLDSRGQELPATFTALVRRALAHYGVTTLDPTPALRESLLWIFKARARADQRAAAVASVLERRLAGAGRPGTARPGFAALVNGLVAVSEGRHPAVNHLAREIRYRALEEPAFARQRDAIQAQAESRLSALAASPFGSARAAHVAALVDCPQPLKGLVARRFDTSSPAMRQLMTEVMVRRYYRIRELEDLRGVESPERSLVTFRYAHEDRTVRVIAVQARFEEAAAAIADAAREVAATLPEHDPAIELYFQSDTELDEGDPTAARLAALLDEAAFGRPLRRAVVVVAGPGASRDTSDFQTFTFRPSPGGYREQRLYRGMHPMMAKRLQLWRLRNFFIDRLPSVEDVYVFRAVAREYAKDERLFALAEVRDVTVVRDAGRGVEVPQLERMALEAFTAIRRIQARRLPAERLHWNRVVLYVRPPLDLPRPDIEAVAARLGEGGAGLGLEKVVVCARMRDPESGELRDTVLSIAQPEGQTLVLRFGAPGTEPIRALDEYKQKVLRMRQRGMAYPYEVITMLAPAADTQSDLPPGEFVEHDLDERGSLVPVDRPYGQNKANIVVGTVRNVTPKYPEGMTRVILLGDPSKEVGSLAEPECARIIAGLDLAERLRVPLEWFALSAGAKISMESGTENMDWIARVLRRLIEYTQAGGEVNLVIMGITVGGQPYWNAEATMLMHTRGILIMTPEAAMVLTGKMALDYSGSVSAEDNQGIGGYERIMGPNGQAQYWARDLAEACRTLLRYYDHTYVVPGERFPRRAATSDPAGRDVRSFSHDGIEGFQTVGGIFSDETNAGRKKPFDIRHVLRAVSDQDHQPLERWAGWRDAENAVTWEAHIGGFPVCLLGFESRPVPRLGLVATDGPEQWTGGTLYPMASKKVARAINAASGNRPLVILANLSGFDGSPESMRQRQLEYGAEIGRAVVNFKGPIVFCVISRYHGGAFVVFSKALAANMEVVALEGTYASVIGGAPAAAVVFARDVDARTRTDPRVKEAEREVEAAPDEQQAALRTKLAEVTRIVRSEKLGEVADEFDRIHSVHRALRVGSLDRIIKPADLRPYIVDAIERGIARELQRLGVSV